MRDGRGHLPLRKIRDGLVADKRSEASVTGANGAYVGTLTLHRTMEIALDGIRKEDHAAL